MTSYTPTHTSGDLSSVVIDFIVEYGVQVLAFAGLIALVTLGIWAKNSLT